MAVTRDYFRVLGLKPILGRTFPVSETGAPPAPVMIPGYDFWNRKFDGDPNIIRKTVPMSRRDVPPAVVGVMPPGVRFLPQWNVVARLQAGSAPQQGQEELRLITARQAQPERSSYGSTDRPEARRTGFRRTLIQ